MGKDQPHGIASVPTVMLAEQRGAIRVVGEVPLAQYRRSVEWLCATSGVISPPPRFEGRVSLLWYSPFGGRIQEGEAQKGG